MLSKFYKSLYSTVLVNIVISESKTTIHIEMLNSKEVTSVSEEVFDTQYLSTEMEEYIAEFTKESPFFYISILDNSISQGAIPTCSKQNIPLYYDLSSSEYKCQDNKWIYYTAKNDLYELEKIYSKVGIDFIFSPFTVLSHFFKDKIDSYLAMFILVEEDAVTLSIFDNSELLFGEYLVMEKGIESDELLIDEDDDMDLSMEEESIDLDDIDAIDDIDELDDFGDIADLDSIEDIDEFSDAKDIEEELAETLEDESPIKEEDGFSEDYQIFSLIQSSVKSFYNNNKYSSVFIENVYIGDSVGVSSDLKKYLEEEMFLNVYIRQLDLAAEVCEIAKMELS